MHVHQTIAPAPTRAAPRPRQPAAVHRILELQATAGNRATALLLQKIAAQRVAATPSPAALKPFADLDTMTLGQFNTYANQQAGWAHETSLTAQQKTDLIATLEFARAGKPAPLSGLSELTVHDVIASGLAAPIRTTLRTYARGVAATDTAKIDRSGVFADAQRDGEALGKLEAAIPKPILHKTMGVQDSGKAQFRGLITDGKIDAFATYYLRARPALEDPDGADISSYRAMISTDGKDPVSYVGVLPNIHNYHRFLAPMLDTLKTNSADVSKAKPLLLILHSGSDHNGAFHRDAELMKTVQHPRNLTVMVEGAATLESLGAQAESIAKRQGAGDKIDQLMLAGHGNARLIEMAGQQRPDGSFRHDDVDLDANRKRTEKFLKKLVGQMAPGPNSRILLNACLTAADQVNATLPADPAKAKAQILRSLNREPSLAARLGQIAPGVSVEGNVSSVGAGEYMEFDAHGNPTGLLHGTVAGDPFATTSNRGDYIEHGTEAEGCIRAVVAQWALNQADCLARIAARRARAVTDWDDRVVHAVYDILHAAPNNIAFINKIVTSGGAGGLSEFDLTAEQKPTGIGGLVNSCTAAELTSVLGPLYAHLPDSGKLAMDAAWMFKDPARRATFLTALNTFASAQDAQPHLSMSWLAPSMGALLPLAAAAAPSTAQAKLALYGVTGGRTDAHAIAFLRAGAAASGKIALPVGTTVDGLSGSATEDDVLTTIGLRGGGGGGGGPTNPVANFDTDGDGTNDVFVESVTRQGVVTAFRLRLRSGPALTAAPIDLIPAREQLYIFGTSGSWLAVDRPGGGTGFVHRSWVRMLAPA